MPETVRPGLRQAINISREGLRSSASASDRAGRTVEVQCAQSHILIRERLLKAYGCDFPEPSAEAMLLARQGPAPRR